MSADPLRECSFREPTHGEVQHDSDDFGFRGLDLIPVEAEEDRHGDKGDALVPVAVRMVAGKSKSIGCSKTREVAGSAVRPAMPGTRQGGFQGALIAKPGETAVGAQEIELYGVDNEPIQPGGFASRARHELLRELAESVPVLSRYPGRNGESALGIGIIGCQQDSSVGLHGQDAIPGAEVKSISHIFWQSGPNGAAHLAQREFTSHRVSEAKVYEDTRDVAQQCYFDKLNLATAQPE